MVIGLIKDLLGPRNGPFETLPLKQDPRTEYITGVLAPEQQRRDLEDIDADIDEIAVEEDADDELPGTSEGAVIAPPSAFSPALDPKAQPRSIGLSFVIVPDEAGTIPVIDICATWARYERQPEDWARRPTHALLTGISLDTDGFDQTFGVDVSLYMRVRRVEAHYRVSLYLLNERGIDHDKHAETPDFLFQPQIRVHCVSGKPAPVETAGTDAMNDPFAQEDRELALLYRERPVLARGHLCGAIWRDIDPERPHPELPSPDEAPFTWIDRVLVSSENQRRFSPANVRTEFLPCYPIEAPETNWSWNGVQPQFDPLILAEIWEPDEIYLALDPLVDGYLQWIEEQEQVILSLPGHWQSPAKRNLDRCRETAARMREGIDRLMLDEDVRLAFCFANQAIALQSRWARNGKVFPWRPFQLAFILLNITGMADPAHPDRSICDLLWFPTGGGKTEAYLGLAAFTLGLRRLRARRTGRADRGAGVSVLSRYTLRLLTIQQFRRALGVITACEYLRVENLTLRLDQPIGWRPAKCQDKTRFLWGAVRFSAGMWVGGNVTPNNLLGFEFPTSSGQFRRVAGAIDILRGVHSSGYDGHDQDLKKRYQGKRVDAAGDPAQVLSCPACGAILAVPEDGLGPGSHTLHFVFSARLRNSRIILSTADRSPIRVDDISPIVDHSDPDTHTLSITFTVADNRSFSAREVDNWWHEVICKQIQTFSERPVLLAARPARPGYFLCTFLNQQSHETLNNFELYCANPQCPLNCHDWMEQVPVNVNADTKRARTAQEQPAPGNEKWSWQDVLPFVRKGRDPRYGERIPIPACTTDDQIYHRCPSLVIATVDKFARLAFEPKASSLFGNVTHYHARWGFYREGCAPGPEQGDHPPMPKLRVPVQPFLPPELIIQDELHLLEGPLGSMVGLYETAVDALSERQNEGMAIRPKYVSSSATVRQAGNQVQALFDRSLASFPPSATSVDDRFFARTAESHPLDCSRAGRLYVAISAPGKGAQTPIVRIWSALLQKARERRDAGAGDELDAFWTLVGYFNALRELAGALALYRQDIPQRLLEQNNPRDLYYKPMELSSRASSLDLPAMLEKLGIPWSEDAVLATSMFGTGVDVNRLGLMVVHGQPKTTSSYIQATGRVGRLGGGLVVTFFRVSRPRDLDHYEFFTGYHRMLYRAVEPVTVTPFAPRARDRCLGPLSVAVLRQASQISGIPVSYPWNIERRVSGGFYSRAIGMDDHRYDTEVEALPDLFERRSQRQPEGRRPPIGTVRDEAASELDRWHDIASKVARAADRVNDRLVYAESAMTRTPERSVVLGDAQHQLRRLPVAFENAPNSLRDVEETTQFKE